MLTFLCTCFLSGFETVTTVDAMGPSLAALAPGMNKNINTDALALQAKTVPLLDSYSSSPVLSRTERLPKLDSGIINVDDGGNLLLPVSALPSSASMFAKHITAATSRNEFVFFSLEPTLQQYAEKILREVRAPHAVAVAM
ncbi:hypothetical protein OAO01_06985, partial [Oligoflexia bacterium]|nr:hypothetical protein [Oligoflexia bacterium]